LKAFNPNVDWHTGRLSGKWGLKLEQQDQAKRILKELQIKALRMCGIPRENEGIYMRWTSFAWQWSTAVHKIHDHLTQDTLPAEYQNHACIFNQNLTAHFPPNRAKNFTIMLKLNAPDHLDCKVYPLNKRETEVACSKIQEGLKEGPSPFQSLVFFIAKKEGDNLWMVINYQKLNNITVSDKYYMPDTQTKLDKLKGKCLFSKFNIKDSYHNILIDPKDWHKAAFKTPIGSYIPKVMTFGLKNAPSVFQQAINRDLRKLK
jgi:hypothetical protein